MWYYVWTWIRHHSFGSDRPGNVLLWDNWINYMYSSISRLTPLLNTGAEHWAPASLCLSSSLLLFIVAVFCPSQPRPLWRRIYSASLSGDNAPWHWCRRPLLRANHFVLSITSWCVLSQCSQWNTTGTKCDSRCPISAQHHWKSWFLDIYEAIFSVLSGRFCLQLTKHVKDQMKIYEGNVY